jgi:hypothetical protein
LGFFPKGGKQILSDGWVSGISYFSPLPGGTFQNRNFLAAHNLTIQGGPACVGGQGLVSFDHPLQTALARCQRGAWDNGE